jgi:hypothetical protein
MVDQSGLTLVPCLGDILAAPTAGGSRHRTAR